MSKQKERLNLQKLGESFWPVNKSATWDNDWSIELISCLKPIMYSREKFSTNYGIYFDLKV